MKTRLKVLAAALAMVSVSAQAELYQAGPVSAANGHFPIYYQDLNGLALDLCLPAPNSIEQSQGLCLLLPADIPNPTAALSFPGNFPEEAFWWNGGAAMTFGDGSKVNLVMGLEAAFANGGPAAGDQIVFARIRFKFFAPVAGKYKITHPYGSKEVETKTPGEKVFVTEDVGALCGLDFTCAVKGSIGPFLRPSNTEGGAALPVVVIDGKTYIADPATNTFVTGSPFNTNYFKVEGPAGSNLDGAGNDFVETNQFTLMGRVHTAPLPSNINVEKAIYSRSADDSTTRINLNVRAIKGLGQPDPQLKLFGEGMPGISLSHNGSKPGNFYGQVVLNSSTVPASVFISDLLEQNGRMLPVTLVDQVTVKQAHYDDVSHELHVEAESSDKSNSHSGSLKLTAVGTDGTVFGDLTNGILTAVLNPALPPAKVIVRSNRGGRDEMEVTISGNDVETNDGYKANDDDNVAINAPINVVANDATRDNLPIPAGNVKVRIVVQPEHGSVVVNADQTVTFIQNGSMTGTDAFSYYLTDAVGGNVSNVAKVKFNLNDGNLPPNVAADSASVGAGATISIDVLANDNDPDNDTLTLTSVTQPAQGIVSIVDNKIMFNAAGLAGNSVQTFDYTVSDGHSHTATASVTVTVAMPEVVQVAVAEFRTSKSQWRISGTDTPATLGVEITITVGGVEVGKTLTLADGTWDWRSTNTAFRQGIVRAISSRGAVGTLGAVTVRK